MTFVRTIGLTAVTLLLSVSSFTAEAKKHLDRDELRILSATSVAVVYVDTEQPIQPHIPNAGGITPMAQLVADSIAQRQLNQYLARIAPYRSLIDKLGVPEITRKGVQEALASVAILHKQPWTVAVQHPDDNYFMKEQAPKTKAQVVIFIRPRLMMNQNADHFFMVSDIDIETLNANGTGFNHYDVSGFSTEFEVEDDDQLPPLASPPPPGISEEDLRAMKIFANDGAVFMQIHATLLQQTQQKLYYFFTGQDTLPPPAAATHPASAD